MNHDHDHVEWNDTSKIDPYPQAKSLLDLALRAVRNLTLEGQCGHCAGSMTAILCAHHPTVLRCFSCALSHEKTHDEDIRYGCDQCGKIPLDRILRPFGYCQPILIPDESGLWEGTVVIGTAGVCHQCL